MISAREHYLMQPVVDAFTDYLADYIAGRVFDPPYLTQTYRPKAQYCFTSLQDAWEQYIQEVPNREFQERLIRYEKPLKEVIDKRDDEAFIQIVIGLVWKSWTQGGSRLCLYPCQSNDKPVKGFYILIPRKPLLEN